MSVPSTIYPQLALVINDVREGMTVTQACQTRGLLVATFLKNVRGNSEMFLQYEEACQESYDRLADKLINIDEEYPDAKMAKVISGNIQWLLERRKPDSYGRKLTVENTGTADKRIIDALNAAIERIPYPQTNDALAATSGRGTVIDVTDESITEEEMIALGLLPAR